MKNISQNGFTLIEILVTIIIFAFGLLGLAGLQLVSLSSIQSANYRSIANLKAYDMTERIRSNSGTNYDGLTGIDNQCRVAHYNNANISPADCTPSLLAQDDIWDWSQELSSELPAGNGIVCIDSTPEDGTPAAPACDGIGTTYAIKIWWTDKPKSVISGPQKQLTVSVGG